ncbi:MAG: hypothetical protein KDB14_34505 [Planctomycetales bacterium]|nr:hypothetical protein [Planctomycetales bacterium]
MANSRTIKTPILEVDLILHSTMPGVAPHRIYLDRFGIDVYPSEPSQIPFGLLINDNVEQNLGPRLPVIGLRAFSYGSVDVHMKCTLGCITVDLFVPDNAG